MGVKLDYITVKNYLETYSTDEPPFDFNGLLHLILAGTENLRRHAIDQDFSDYACAITDDQALFLRRLLDERSKSITEFNKEA